MRPAASAAGLCCRRAATPLLCRSLAPSGVIVWLRAASLNEAGATATGVAGTSPSAQQQQGGSSGALGVVRQLLQRADAEERAAAAEGGAAGWQQRRRQPQQQQGGLVRQRIELPPSFEVPRDTTVAAYQLVGVFRSMLGRPDIPHGATRTVSLESKWAQLELALLLAAGRGEEFDSALEELLEGVLLPQARGKLGVVLGNPRVPEANRVLAQRRFESLRSSCRSAISAWAAQAAASPAFQLLRPALEAVAPALRSSVAAGHHRSPCTGSRSGRLMEETALAVLRESLPAGWTLLPALQVLGIDGEPIAAMPGCSKYEVDLLALDEAGQAVAVVEVKRGASNPLVTMLNDVGGLMRLVKRARGRTITAITKSHGGGGGGEEAAAGGAAWATKAERMARVATGGSLRFPDSCEWRAVHIRVREGAQPVYVVGAPVGDAETRRGLASLVDSSALKLMASSPEAASGALLRPAGGAGGSGAGGGAAAAVAATQLGWPPPVGAGGAEEQRRLGESEGAAWPLSRQGSSASSVSSASSTSSCGTSECSWVSMEGSTRVLLQLSDEQRVAIHRQVSGRMELLQQCLVYSLEPPP